MTTRLLTMYILFGGMTQTSLEVQESNLLMSLDNVSLCKYSNH